MASGSAFCVSNTHRGGLVTALVVTSQRRPRSAFIELLVNQSATAVGIPAVGRAPILIGLGTSFADVLRSAAGLWCHLCARIGLQ